MKLFLFIISSLLMAQGCAAQSQMPKEMPEKISITLHNGGGMSRSYKKIRIENGLVELEELKGNQKEPQKQLANISDEDLAKLYKIFVDNKFDTIKNDKRKEIVYDAGSENISISLNSLKSFSAGYCKNSPLSGKNLERFQTVRKAIYDLVAQYFNQEINNSLSIEQAEKFIQGKWRVAGEHNKRTWFLEWTFENEKFKQLGYPPLLQEGKYAVISIANNILTLELYDQKGTFGTEKKNIEIVIDQKANQLKISQMSGFSRIVETKTDKE